MPSLVGGGRPQPPLSLLSPPLDASHFQAKVSLSVDCQAVLTTTHNFDKLVTPIAVHLLATDCIVTTSYYQKKIVCFDSKIVSATTHGSNYVQLAGVYYHNAISIGHTLDHLHNSLHLHVGGHA